MLQCKRFEKYCETTVGRPGLYIITLSYKILLKYKSRKTGFQCSVCVRLTQHSVDNFLSQINFMGKILVTHFVIIVAHQILASVTNITCHDFSALTNWSLKLTVSCTPMHIILLVTIGGSTKPLG